MLSQPENALLTCVGRDAPMGQMLRRYWLPALLCTELPQPECPPRQVRLLGEDLVAFRCGSGRVGLLDKSCPHRGASLVLARCEGEALQCIYHGWKIAADGAIVGTPAEPEAANFRSRIRHLAYPTREAGGIVWTYLGPPGTEPTFPAFPFTLIPDSQRFVYKARLECNWTQGVEGIIDSAHSNQLHQWDVVPATEGVMAGEQTSRQAADAGRWNRPSNDPRPRLEVQDTAYGFRYVAIRKPIVDPDRFKYLRVTLFVAPSWGLISPPAGWGLALGFAPMDDEHTMVFSLEWRLEGDIVDRDQHYERVGAVMGRDLDADFRKAARSANNWLQDREAMRRGSFSGLRGVQNQDMAVQESVGPIYDRQREHLGTSDVAIIRFRRLMLDAVQLFQRGEPPLGQRTPFDYGRLRAEERIVPLSTPWQEVGAYAGEPVAP